MHSAVGEGAGVEDKEVLGGFWGGDGWFVWLGVFYWVIWVHEFFTKFQPYDVDVYGDYLLCVLWDGGLIRRF